MHKHVFCEMCSEINDVFVVEKCIDVRRKDETASNSQGG